jgi:hypothetical protein
MEETPLDLEAVRRRHLAVLGMYGHLTGAEQDRAALLLEVDRLGLVNQRLQRLVEELQRDGGAGTVPVEVARLARDPGGEAA